MIFGIWVTTFTTMPSDSYLKTCTAYTLRSMMAALALLRELYVSLNFDAHYSTLVNQSVYGSGNLRQSENYWSEQLR